MNKQAEKKQTQALEEDYRYKEYDAQITARLFSYLRPYAWLVVAAAAIMTSTSLINLARPWIISQIIDVGIGEHSTTYLFRMVVVYLGLNAFNALAMTGRINIMAWVGTSAIRTMRNQVFRKFQELSIDFFSEHEVGRLMSRMTTDINRVRELISWSVIFLISDAINLIGTVVIMFSMNARLSLISFAVIPVMAVATELWRRRARDAYRAARRANSIVNADLQENINGVRVVQSFSRQESNYRRFADVFNLTMAHL